MRAVALFALALGALSAAAGVAFAVVGFAPIPFVDSIDFFHQIWKVGGLDQFGIQQLYARHNEHRLVVPRLWFLLDITIFDATQAFLIVVTMLSSMAHAALLTLLFRSLGHRGWPLWAFAGAAVGAVLSPGQWENLVSGFQVQFVQVWLFATLAFVAIAYARGRSTWWLVLAGVLAGLGSTYSMANGLLVWPLLVALAMWSGLRGGPLAFLAVAAVAVVAFEVAGFHAHPGHGDPLKTIAEPGKLLLYAFRYLTNGIGAIGTGGQEVIGALLSLAVIGLAIDAIVRRSRYSPAHAVLLAIAGFIIAAALATALGRVNFGVGQANVTRYATPSFIFLLATGALLSEHLLKVRSARMKAGAAVIGIALLLVPGLIEGVKHVQSAIDQRNARINAIVSYIAGGYRPAELLPLYPFLPIRPFRAIQLLDAQGWGPFAERERFMPPRALLDAAGGLPVEICRGQVHAAFNDPVDGVVVIGWAAAATSAEAPEWILVADRAGRVVGWGAGRIRHDDVDAALDIDWRDRGFTAFGPTAAEGPLAVTAAFADGRRCVLDLAVKLSPPRFLSELPVDAQPATDAGWVVAEGTGTDRTGPDTPPDGILPAIGTLGEASRLVASIELEAPLEPATLAVPLRTGKYPMAVDLVVEDVETGDEIARYDFGRPSDVGWVWRVFEQTADPRRQGHRVRVRVIAAGPRGWQGIAVGRPYWLPGAPRR